MKDCKTCGADGFIKEGRNLKTAKRAMAGEKSNAMKASTRKRGSGKSIGRDGKIGLSVMMIWDLILEGIKTQDFTTNN